MNPSRLVNRNVISLRGRTSMRLEPELWEALHEICHRECLGLGTLIKRVEEHGHPGGRTSAVRVYVLRYFRDAGTEDGHHGAGHGPMQVSAASVRELWPLQSRAETAAAI